MRLPLVLGTALLALVAGSTSEAKGPQPVLAYATAVDGNLDVMVSGIGDPSPRRLTSSPDDEFSPSWSPDGTRIAYRVSRTGSGVSDIWVMRPDGTRKRNLTRTPRVAEWSPAFAPDGKRIAYFSLAGGGDVWVMRADGTARRKVTRNGSLNEYPTWSPDGRSLAFNSHRDGQFEIYRIGADGSRARNLTRHPAKDQWPAWSPDGRLIAFMSERNGGEDVFVMHADGSRVRNLTRTLDLDESHPAWTPDGGLTFTRHGQSGPVELWIADVNDASNAVRVDTKIEPVFVYAWKPR